MSSALWIYYGKKGEILTPVACKKLNHALVASYCASFLCVMCGKEVWTWYKDIGVQVVMPILGQIVASLTTRVYAYSHIVVDHLCRLCNLYFMEFIQKLTKVC